MDYISSKKIVYIGEFDKRDAEGNLICRNVGCINHPQPPYRKYCSKKCNREFRRWYYNNFYWEKVRSNIFKRDSYTCQICRIDYSCRNRKKYRRRNLECDHIVPRSLFEQRGYKFDTFENKIKATLEFFHSPNNLRTVCYSCHKHVTAIYLRGKHVVTESAEGESERLI